MSLQQLGQLFFALALVITLMGGLAYALKRLGLGSVAPAIKKAQKRLKVIESQPLDARRRLVILQCDNKQHLVIMGVNGETVIETNIGQPEQSGENLQGSPTHA